MGVMRVINVARIKARQRKLLRAFENDDLETIRKMGPPTSSRLVAEIGFHKARYASKGVSKTKRDASLKWLKDRGYNEEF